MSDDFYKLIFLGVMILVALAGSRGVAYREADNFSTNRFLANVAQESPFTANSAESAASIAEPPLFILQPPAQERNGVVAKSPATSQPVDVAASSTDGFWQQVQATASRILGVFPDNGNNAKSIISGQENSGSISASNRALPENYIEPPEVQAQSSLVADLYSGRVFFAKSSQKRWPIASITKLVTATIVSKNFPMNEAVTIKPDDFPLGEAGTMDFTVGDKYAAQDLFSAMLMKSSNESAEALADFLGRKNFVSEMNNLALAWGLADTHFDDPTGLSVANQSTAENLRLLAKNIYERQPEVFSTTRKTETAMTELNSGKKVIINNINLFAGKKDFLGGKTGYTDEAGGNLLSIFSYKTQPLFIVVLGSNDRFGETEKLLNWFRKNF